MRLTFLEWTLKSLSLAVSPSGLLLVVDAMTDIEKSHLSLSIQQHQISFQDFRSKLTISEFKACTYPIPGRVASPRVHLPGEVVVHAGVSGLLPVPLVRAQVPEVPLHLIQRLRVVKVALRRGDGVEEFLLIGKHF